MTERIASLQSLGMKMLTSKRLSQNVVLYIVFLVALFICSLVMFGQRAGAIPGAPSNFFPDVNPTGARDVYAITQIVGEYDYHSDGTRYKMTASQRETKMKARTTTAAIYVPESLLGQTINVTIIHGCDGSGARDGSWWNGGYTTFRVTGPGNSPVDSRSCGSNSNKNIDYSFTPSIRTGRQLVVYDGIKYHVQSFIADGGGPESGYYSDRYINTFQLQVNTPGVNVGLSYTPIKCEVYTVSCPPSSGIQMPDNESGSPVPNASYSYSSFYGSATPNTMRIDMTFGCNGGKGQILVYDLDADIPFDPPQNLNATIKRNGEIIGQLNGNGLISYLGGRNNNVLKVPISGYPDASNPLGYPYYDFLPNTTYQMEMSGMSKDNAFQILPNFWPKSGDAGCVAKSSIGCSSFPTIIGKPNDYAEVTFTATNNSTFDWVPSGNRYDIGVVDTSFEGAKSNEVGTKLPPQGLGPPDHNSSQYVQPNTNGTNAVWHSESYTRNGQASSVHRYGTSSTIPAGGTANFSVWVKAPSSGSKEYGIRMLSRDARFAPFAWMDWSDSCAFTVSASPGADGSPVGFIDSCELINGKTVIKGWGYDDNAAANDGKPNVIIRITGGATDTRTLSTTETYRIDGVHQYLNTSGYGTNARDTVYGFITEYSGLYQGGSTPYTIGGTVVNVASGADQQIGVRQQKIRADLQGYGFPSNIIPNECLPPANRLPVAVITVSCSANGSKMTIVVAGVQDPDSPTTALPVQVAVPHRGGPSNFTAAGYGNDGSSTLSLARNDGIKLSGLEFDPNYGGANSTRTVTASLTDVQTGEVVAVNAATYTCTPVPECSIGTISASARQPFYVKVILKNNTGADIPVSGPADYQVRNSSTNAIVASGKGDTYDVITDIANVPSYPQTIPAGGTLAIRSQTQVTLTTPGLYDAGWSVLVDSGPPIHMAIGDCGSTPVPPDNNLIDVTTKPYMKFFGNDVFAGGAFGSTCNITSSPNVYGYGAYTGSQPHANYKGAAAELAVFAAGQIDGVLPGSQDTTRASGTTLAFSNTSLGTGSLPFGGGFTSPLCVDDFWAAKPAAPKPLPVADDPIASNLSAKKVDLATLADGDYEFTGQVHLYASGPIKSRLTIYVNGTTVIGSTASATYDYKVAYDTTGWTSYDKIPMLKVVTFGNAYVDDNVVQFDGLLVAEPDPAVLAMLKPSGEIHTCSLFGQGIDLTYPALNQAALSSGCNHQLVVNGAFIAKRVKLLRTVGDVASAAAAPEAYSSANIAEVFRFSPELYLGMLSEARATQQQSGFDSLLSPPPAL